MDAMTRDAEIRASEQMRDRIADMLERAGMVRDRQGKANQGKGKLLYAMARQVRALLGRPAKKEADDET